MKIINRTVWILSFVSLFADVASEMLYPVVPVYLQEIGFSFFLIGLLEGFAEFTAGLSKGYFGKLSDEKGIRLPFIKAGYFLSAVSKPMMAVFTFPLWIFLAFLPELLIASEKDFALQPVMRCLVKMPHQKPRPGFLVFTVEWIHWVRSLVPLQLLSFLISFQNSTQRFFTSPYFRA
jgi:hypothetical protein